MEDLENQVSRINSDSLGHISSTLKRAHLHNIYIVSLVKRIVTILLKEKTFKYIDGYPSY